MFKKAVKTCEFNFANLKKLKKDEFDFCKLKKLKNHEFNFLQVSKSSKNMKLNFCKFRKVL
tara:strand:- start:127 stop:309 length:183 start_codon:yes stop_codon:yes gene_type:complete